MSNTSELRLEQAKLGELTEAERSELTEQDLAKVEALRASDEAILARYPPSGVRIEVERRAKQRNRRGRAWVRPMILSLASAVAAGALLFKVADDSSSNLEPARFKGEARLIIHRKTRDEVTQLHDGDVVSQGDLLQVGYTAGGSGTGAIVSLDGRGTVTIHLPESQTWSPALEPKGQIAPSAYELDDAPDFERFFFVRCPEKFRVMDIVHQVETIPDTEAATKIPEVDADCRVDSLLLRKEAP